MVLPRLIHVSAYRQWWKIKHFNEQHQENLSQAKPLWYEIKANEITHESEIAAAPRLIFMVCLLNQDKNLDRKMANGNVVVFISSQNNPNRYKHITYTEGWMRHLHPTEIFTPETGNCPIWCSSMDCEMWLHLPRSKVSELLLSLMTLSFPFDSR